MGYFKIYSAQKRHRLLSESFSLRNVFSTLVLKAIYLFIVILGIEFGDSRLHSLCHLSHTQSFGNYFGYFETRSR
jgi:hypothetical protein